MFSFVKVINTFKGMNLEYGYCLKMTNIVELMAYENATIGRYAEGFEDAHKALQRDQGDGFHHLQTSMGLLLKQRADFNGGSLAEIAGQLSSEIFNNRWRTLNIFGALYFQKCGSYMPKIDTMLEIGEIVESEWFPEYTEKDIKIIKWTNGRHYYAKIGDLDVVINGEQKWGTEEMALVNARKFLNTL